MKKTLICLAVAFMAMTSATAQVDKRLFNHLAVGLDVGTTGIGADVAVPCTKYLEIQAGFMIMPKIKISTSLNLDRFDYKDANGVSQMLDKNNLKDIPIEGKLNLVNGKLMFNAYPFPKSSFHVTVGAYFGSSDIIEVYNTTPGQLSPINEANAMIREANAKADQIPNYKIQKEIGLELDDYLLQPDPEGNASASLKVNGFKPYVGLGVGRAVPGRTRLNFKFDIGAMFWGSPDIVDHNGHSLMSGLGSEDGGAIRFIRKLKVYPVLNFRLSGRIF